MTTMLLPPLSERIPDTSDLSEPVLDALEELVKANLACADSLREAGSATPAIPLGTHLEGMARRRVSAARELKAYLTENGNPGPTGGPSLLFTLSLLWDHLKLAIQGGKPLAVIRHVSGAGHELEEAYRDVLGKTTGCPLNALFMAHLRQLRADARSLRQLEGLLTSTEE